MNGYLLFDIIGDFEIYEHDFKITIYAKSMLTRDQILRAYSLLYSYLSSHYLIDLVYGNQKINAIPTYKDYTCSKLDFAG